MKAESVAETMRRLRLQSGLSLRQIEQRSGLPRSTISRLESGRHQLPTAATLQRLAKSMDVDATELLAAAGHIKTEAEALPAIRPYLRTKYGHLSAAAQAELAEVLERLEQEQTDERTNAKKTKGGKQ